MEENTFAIEPPAVPTLPVAGGQMRFPVGRIFCVGRNYAAHAAEMGHGDDRDPPFFFMKPGDAVVQNGETIAYPSKTDNLHHEIELVAALEKGGCNIPLDDALDHIYGYAAGIDLTRRDLQGEAKKLGRPWEVGKAFENSAPCTAVHRIDDCGHPLDKRIWLSVNGQERQAGSTKDMIWSVAEIIHVLSGLFTLKPGDLIFTGTPAGVDAVSPGDRITGGVDGVDEISIEIA